MGDWDMSACVDGPSGKRLGWIDEDWRQLFTPISSSQSMPHSLSGARSLWLKHTCIYLQARLEFWGFTLFCTRVSAWMEIMEINRLKKTKVKHADGHIWLLLLLGFWWRWSPTWNNLCLTEVSSELQISSDCVLAQILSRWSAGYLLFCQTDVFARSWSLSHIYRSIWFL